MRLDWELRDEYDEIGGQAVLRDAVKEAVEQTPREHLRRLDALLILDDDPKGRSLGLWRQDHDGFTIEIYVRPHVEALLPLPPAVRDFALRLHLAYTLFHEVGHHVTRVLNKRAAPPRKADRVEEKIEKWADEYAEKRVAKLCALWLRPEGRADTPEGGRALAVALRALRLDRLVVPPPTEAAKEAINGESPEGTKAAGPAS